MTPRTGWKLNLQISGFIDANTVEKAVSWNIGPHGYKGRREAVHQIYEQGPPIQVTCLQDMRIRKCGKRNVKRELQRIFPHYWICITAAQSLQTNSRNLPYVFSVLTALHSHFSQGHTSTMLTLKKNEARD